jgi:cytochrome c biogenesis protein CcmG/thiol:disulfide interchange protein DsbE
MQRMIYGATCLAAAFLLVAPVPAQEGPGKPDAAEAEPDAVEYLRRAERALSELKSMTYSARNEGFGATATRSPAVTGTVAARRYSAEDQSGWHFRLDCSVRPPRQTGEVELQVAFDASGARSVDHAKQTVTQSSGDGLEDLLVSGGGRLVNWLEMWSTVVSIPLAADDGSIVAKYEGQTVVGGVVCDVIVQDTTDFTQLEEYVLWWFLGAEDHLPRRLDSFYLEVAGAINGMDVLTITDLKPGAEVSDASLALATPEGFRTVTIEPERPAVRAGSAPAPSSLVGKPAPAWTLKDPQGIDHSLADYKGKVVVIDFWATWCSWCKVAMPELQQLHEAYAGKGVEVVGITLWEAGDPVKYMKDKGFTYSLLLQGDDLAQPYGIQGIPRLIIVGKDGTVVHDLTGYDPNADLGAVIDKALAAE